MHDLSNPLIQFVHTLINLSIHPGSTAADSVTPFSMEDSQRKSVGSLLCKTQHPRKVSTQPRLQNWHYLHFERL